MEQVEGKGVIAAAIAVRHCAGLTEFEQCVALERLTWGEDILVPAAIFVVAQETGGQVLGAFEGRRLVGFTLALAGVRDRVPFLHSHMTAVLPEVQNRGVGRQLKLAQREDALRRGIGLVEWTFDPLELKNARLNLVRLGAIARRYIPNCYGITDSPLHAGMPTDRLVAEWWLDSLHVEAVLAGKAAAPAKDFPRISLPADIADLRQRDRAAAEAVQREVRRQFERCFGRGYIVTGIEISTASADYLLAPPEALRGQVGPLSEAEKR